MSKKIYICTECKKRILSVNDVLFIEDISNKGFCSEICILNFYRAYMEHFENEELEFRAIHGISSEDDIDFKDKQEELFHQVLYAPNEVWLETSELREEYYTHLLKVELEPNDFVYLIFVCSYFDSSPSFIYHKCFTRDERVVACYQTGKKVEIDAKEVYQDYDEDESDYDGQIELPTEVLEEIEQKKSQYLAELLASRSDSDIQFEEFVLYDKYIQPTLEDPDEIYENEDNGGEEVSTYIKSFQQGQESFFYIVLCWKCQVEDVDGDVLVPVLSFPSINQDLYKEYAIGTRTKGQVKN